MNSYNIAANYYEQTKHAFIDNAPKNPSETLDRLRTFAQSYLIIIPGAGPHVDAAFDTIDELRDEHGDEVDRIVGGGYEEVRIIVRDAAAMDVATAMRVLGVLQRRGGELEELGRRAGSGVFESLARKYPQVSEKLGVGYEEFKKLAQTKGPEAKKVFDDTGKQVCMCSCNGAVTGETRLVLTMALTDSRDLQKGPLAGQREPSAGVDPVEDLRGSQDRASLIPSSMGQVNQGGISIPQ